MARAAKLAALLESSIQRRFPKGLKVHVHSVDRFGCLAALARVLKLANLTVTRAKARRSAPWRSATCPCSLPLSGAGVAACCRRAQCAPPPRGLLDPGSLTSVLLAAFTCSAASGARPASWGRFGAHPR